MGLLNLGRDMLADAIIGGTTYDKLDNSNAYLCVGDGDDAFDASDTDLQGSNKTRKAMEATYPQRTANAITFRSVFGTSDANYAWEEWGVANASSSGQMFNREVEDNGTKAGTASVQLTVTLTIAHG